MKRRTFISFTATGIVSLAVDPAKVFSQEKPGHDIRLGGPVFEKYDDPDLWIQLIKNQGYRAAYCPVDLSSDADLIKQYRITAERNDIVIAEVGAWCNPISPDDNTAQKAIEKCIASLVLADKLGARCCVNVSGSRNANKWAGPHPENLTPGTFDLIVETTRKIIDAVKPTQTWFTLEAMPWAYPDSADSYLKLIKAVARNRFAVHLDPVNLVTSPQIIYANGKMIRETFQKLGQYIKSCHAKDIIIREDTDLPQMEEVRPGLGILNYAVYLSELSKLNDVPLMMEHLKSQEEYTKAASYIRSVGKSLSIRF